MSTVPACGLLDVKGMDFSEVLHVVSCPDGDFRGGVGLVAFEIEVHGDLLDAGFFHELDVN